ncbi:MAG: ribosome small subunit-dependent GTPase A [Planctomycetota bacterium]|jgi:ribosome biogenesis GTPase
MKENGVMSLSELGWSDFFSRHFETCRDAGLIPARIAREHRQLYHVYAERGELLAEVSGKMLHNAVQKSDFPAVGDWVAIQPQPGGSRAVIHAILPRKSCFTRKVAGDKSDEQVVASNIDTVFLVSGLDGGRNFNIRRIERYLTLAYNSNAAPVVVLNKADVCDDIESKIAAVESVACGVPVHAVSALAAAGIGELDRYLESGKTVAFLGSSGVGKSSLINCLAGAERQKVFEIRKKDGRGRHTTTARELILLESGASVIDTPGMRELQIAGEEKGMAESFEDIELLAGKCRFRDCRHENEPGCAIHEALRRNELDTARYESYLEIRKELEYNADRSDYLQKKKEKFKQISKWSKSLKNRGKNR